jgi:mevalonate kinase
MIKTSAPSRVILFGEHAINFGESAIATAIDKRAYVTACELEEKKILVESKNLGTSVESQIYEKTEDPVVRAVQLALKHAKKESGIGIEINSEIPVGVGLGSSASVITATISSVLNLFSENPIGVQTLETAELAHKAEKITHETPSGIDTAITSFGGTISFKKGLIEKLETEGLSLIIGNTGSRGSKTETLGRVQHNIGDPRMAHTLFSISSIANSAKKAIMDNNLKELGKLEKLVKTARDAGAYGAKLTGAGGGGCAVILTKNLGRVTKAIEDSGFQAFEVKTNQEGVRIE